MTVSVAPSHVKSGFGCRKMSSCLTLLQPWRHQGYNRGDCPSIFEETLFFSIYSLHRLGNLKAASSRQRNMNSSVLREGIFYSSIGSGYVAESSLPESYRTSRISVKQSLSSLRCQFCYGTLATLSSAFTVCLIMLPSPDTDAPRISGL